MHEMLFADCWLMAYDVLVVVALAVVIVDFDVTRRDMRDEMRASNQHLAMFASWRGQQQQQWARAGAEQRQPAAATAADRVKCHVP